MPPFKFRGSNINNHYVYGNYLTKKKIRHNGTISDAIITDTGDTVPVARPALFIGYDKNGREIYTDDIIVNSAGQNFVAAEYYFPIVCDPNVSVAEE